MGKIKTEKGSNTIAVNPKPVNFVSCTSPHCLSSSCGTLKWSCIFMETKNLVSVKGN